jgi:hypothetical protein
MIRDLLDSMPVLGVFTVTIAAVLLAIELGFQVGMFRNRRGGADREAPLSAITGAHFALLAFIMGFSFSQAADHFVARKRLILEEANAIGTAHLRAGLVGQAEGAALQKLFGEYAAVRASGARQDLEASELIEQSLALQAEIWQQVERLARRGLPTPLDALLVAAVNDVFDIHEMRVSAYQRNRIPPTLWGVLFLLLIVAMSGMGYFSSMNSKRNPVATTTLALSFSLVMLLIADLDRPRHGLLKTDHSVIVELSRRLQPGGS